MKFINAPADVAVISIAEAIMNVLRQNKAVLWLVCGGSNITVQVAVMKLLTSKAKVYLKNLTILPMDERYGPDDHPDSNYRQMREKGFDAGQATWINVLQANDTLAVTVAAYGDLVQAAFKQADFVIGTFGIGVDGHTAGVLPLSPALAEQPHPVVGYTAPGFIRMTIVPSWLKRCDVSFLLAYGPEKAVVLKRLQTCDLPLNEMPARLHYDIPSATVYNDAIGEEVIE